RLRAVLQAAAARFGWKPIPRVPPSNTSLGLLSKVRGPNELPLSDRGFGIACGFEKGGYVATCAEIAIEPPTDKEDKTNRRVRIVRVVEAFECGAIVNPRHLHNQIE